MKKISRPQTLRTDKNRAALEDRQAVQQAERETRWIELANARFDRDAAVAQVQAAYYDQDTEMYNAFDTDGNLIQCARLLSGNPQNDSNGAGYEIVVVVCRLESVDGSVVEQWTIRDNRVQRAVEAFPLHFSETVYIAAAQANMATRRAKRLAQPAAKAA